MYVWSTVVPPKARVTLYNLLKEILLSIYIKRTALQNHIMINNSTHVVVFVIIHL